MQARCSAGWRSHSAVQVGVERSTAAAKPLTTLTALLTDGWQSLLG